MDILTTLRTMNRTVNARGHGSGWLDLVREQVESLDFGVVQIVVHEGSVVQIERTQKVRLPKTDHPTRPLGIKQEKAQ